MSFPFRNWDGQEIGNEWDISGAWVVTHSPHPYVIVGVGDRFGDDGTASIVMTVEETKKFVDALSEALARIGRMKAVRGER